jgi:hypothetical protein
LNVPDVGQRLGKKRRMPNDQRMLEQFGLAGHRPDQQAIAFEPHAGKGRYPVEIDQQARRREPKIHHRYEALAACEHLGVGILGEQCQSLGQSLRPGHLKDGGLHCDSDMTASTMF